MKHLTQENLEHLAYAILADPQTTIELSTIGDKPRKWQILRRDTQFDGIDLYTYRIKPNGNNNERYV